MLKYLICAFWGHKWEQFKFPIVKTDIQDTANYQEVCKRCGVLTEAYGCTHLGPFEIEIKPMKNERGK